MDQGQMRSHSPLSFCTCPDPAISPLTVVPFLTVSMNNHFTTMGVKAGLACPRQLYCPPLESSCGCRNLGDCSEQIPNMVGDGENMGLRGGEKWLPAGGLSCVLKGTAEAGSWSSPVDPSGHTMAEDSLSLTLSRLPNPFHTCPLHGCV